MDITFRRAESDVTVQAASAGPATTAPATATRPPRDGAADTQRAQVGDLLVRLFEYLDAQTEPHPALAEALPLLSSAVADYRLGGGPDPYAGVRAVMGRIKAVRAADPSIPAS